MNEQQSTEARNKKIDEGARQLMDLTTKASLQKLLKTIGEAAKRKNPLILSRAETEQLDTHLNYLTALVTDSGEEKHNSPWFTVRDDNFERFTWN